MSYPWPRPLPGDLRKSLRLLRRRSEGGVGDRPEHLQRRHLHVRGLSVLAPPRGAVPGGSAHGAEARGGATHVDEARGAGHGRAPQVSTRRHQVAVALSVREGVAGAAGTGAADASAL